jgi:putative hydrolase of the HAD superfamily
MAYRVILFDLFGTLVLFRPKVPTLTVAGTTWRSTMQWLREEMAKDLPEIPFEEFLEAIRVVTEDIVRTRPPEYREVLSPERFCRALQRLGLANEIAVDAGERLSLRHMAHLAAHTEMPAAHALMLRQLAAHYDTGLISNFDHGPTAHRILGASGIAPHLKATLISAEFGRRKPHASIFEAAMRRLGADPGETLYVGDTIADDVVGARGAGIDVVWINANDAAPPAERPQPTYTIRELPELPELLAALS